MTRVFVVVETKHNDGDLITNCLGVYLDGRRANLIKKRMEEEWEEDELEEIENHEHDFISIFEVETN